MKKISISNRLGGIVWLVFLLTCLPLLDSRASVEGSEKDTLDFTFSSDASVKPFKIQHGEVRYGDGKLIYAFQERSYLESPDLRMSPNGVYVPKLEMRNTLFLVMRNNSTATQLKLRFITEKDSIYDDSKSKMFDINPNSPMQAYYFNLSNNNKAEGRIIGFRIEPFGGTGEIEIDRITFEAESRIEAYAGQIQQCIASGDTIVIKGSIRPEYVGQYNTIAIYETSIMQYADDISAMEKLVEIPITQSFEIKNIPLKEKNITRLSSQFQAVLKDNSGRFAKISPRFSIENWRDFEDNPYSFDLPDLRVDVVSYGAKGDGFTDDTDAIQKAIDDVSSQGGGQVVLSGDDSFYGRRYVATNIQLRNNVDLHIQQGAVLWQSQNESDYKYRPEYGHDNEASGLLWGHNCLISNLPLIQADSVKNIKITGPGKIRMSDVESHNPTISGFKSVCSDKVHIVPIGLWKASNVEVSDVEIIRSGSYNTAFYGCERVFVGNVKIHEAKCALNGDGISLGFGTRRVKIVRTFIDTNDDGVVLWTVYKDPREGLWWWSKPGENHCIHNIEIYHSFIHAGYGKAIAFIPWGTSDPDWQKEEIYNISIADNVLAGVSSIGVWPDNPYNETPFDNQEKDDYSPVKNIRIFDNRYLNECNISAIKATNIMTDCGINSSDLFLNGDFKHGYANWSLEGDALVLDGVGYAYNGRLYQGLYLKRGSYTITVEALSSGTVFVENADTDEILLESKFRAGKGKSITIPLNLATDGTYFIGIKGKRAKIKQIDLTSAD